MNIPKKLSHTPIIGVDYESQDASAGDAKYLSLGKATWAQGYTDYSAKIFRKSNEGTKHEKWSRQSEELPLWRVLDLAILLVASIQHINSNLREELVGSQDDLNELNAFLVENYNEYAPRLMELRRVLTEKSDATALGNTPNIFSFATSELSQDAFLAWILSWADPSMRKQDSSLNDIAVRLLQKMLGVNSSFAIKSVKVDCQWQKIDIWAEINDDIFLIIEDKTDTSVHDNQLERYREIANDHYKGERRVLGAYVKTGNEPNSIINYIKHIGYTVIERIDVLNCIKDYTGQSDIVKYFLKHLWELEYDTNSFREKPYLEWSWHAWQGFYKELEKHLDIDNWDYVANPAGGFLGIWWNWVSIYDEEYGQLRMYLQIEQPEKLCVKIEFKGERGSRSSVRYKYHQILFKKAHELGISIHNPARFGNGTYMTIGVVGLQEIIGDGLIDIDKTVSKLHLYEGLVTNCLQH